MTCRACRLGSPPPTRAACPRPGARKHCVRRIRRRPACSRRPAVLSYAFWMRSSPPRANRSSRLGRWHESTVDAMASTMAASFSRRRTTQPTRPPPVSLRPAQSIRPSVTPCFCKAELPNCGAPGVGLVERRTCGHPRTRIVRRRCRIPARVRRRLRWDRVSSLVVCLGRREQGDQRGQQDPGYQQPQRALGPMPRSVS